MDDHITTSLIVFIGVEIIFFAFTASYQGLSGSRIAMVQRKSLWADWRVMAMCLVYAFAFGFRYDFAFDWDQYRHTFEYIQHGLLYRDTTEVGYLAINRILGYLGFNYYSIFILEGFFWVFSICYLFKSNRKALLWVLPIVYIGYHFRCLNLSRQFFGLSIYFIALRCLFDGKKLSYWVLSAIAISIHTSAIIFVIPLYFVTLIKRFPPFKIAIVVYIIIAFTKTMFLDFLLSGGTFMSDIVNKEYDADHLMQDRFQWEVSLWRQFVEAMIDVVTIFGIYYMLKVKYITNDITLKLKKKIIVMKQPEYYICLLGLLGAMLRPIGEAHEIFSRTFIYLSAFSLMSLGLWIFYAFRHLRHLNPILIGFTLIVVAQKLYSIFAGVISQTQQGIYIEYRPLTFW